MSALDQSNKLFFNPANLSPDDVTKIVTDSLNGADGGELYIERAGGEMLVWQDNRLVNSSTADSEGFGLRSIIGDKFAYHHTPAMGTDPLLTTKSLKEASDTVNLLKNYGQGNIKKGLIQAPAQHSLYLSDNPVDAASLQEKIKLLQDIDAYARSIDPKVSQVTISLSTAWKAVHIIRHDGQARSDFRPLVQLRVDATVQSGDRQEQGGYAYGGRKTLATLMDPSAWKNATELAVKQALTNLDSVPAPSGEMDVVFGNGWNGVMLHEAVGHGLEGDFNRKGTSAYSGLVGQQVAAKGVTVVDRGDLSERRGSLNFDDEGNPTQENVLIEDGILKGYMQDEMNARLMGVAPTGNGRRQSYAYEPMPRMTSTFIRAGAHTPEEIIESVKDGIYIAALGGGSVDITSGDYNFKANEAYRIRNGKIAEPLKGASLVGNGPKDMKKITMLGNDFNEMTGEGLDPGLGVCGKQGQGVPVGVGQPTLLMRGLTVGGMS